MRVNFEMNTTAIELYQIHKLGHSALAAHECNTVPPNEII